MCIFLLTKKLGESVKELGEELWKCSVDGPTALDGRADDDECGLHAEQLVNAHIDAAKERIARMIHERYDAL